MINAASTSSLAQLRASLSSSLGQSGAQEARPEFRETEREARAGQTKSQDPNKTSQRASEKLTPAEREQVEELKRRDAEVRAHEMAHMAAAGSLARGGPNYVYQTGPDGRNYAIGGNVKIDTSPGRTPEETLRKAAQIRAASLASSDPSPQDLRVASTAGSLAAEAQSKLSKTTDNEDGALPEMPNTRDTKAAINGKSDDPAQTPFARALSNAYRSQRESAPPGAKLAETA